MSVADPLMEHESYVCPVAGCGFYDPEGYALGSSEETAFPTLLRHHNLSTLHCRPSTSGCGNRLATSTEGSAWGQPRNGRVGAGVAWWVPLSSRPAPVLPRVEADWGAGGPGRGSPLGVTAESRNQRACCPGMDRQTLHLVEEASRTRESPADGLGDRISEAVRVAGRRNAWEGGPWPHPFLRDPWPLFAASPPRRPNPVGQYPNPAPGQIRGFASQRPWPLLGHLLPRRIL